MSKQVRIDIECPNCHNQYSDNFFRTIWGENEAFRRMVMNNEVNIAKCPHCGHQFHLPLAMMYVDVEKGFAVWWEPNHDPGVDSDAAAYAQMFGANSYYAQAPRIKGWEEFKCVINEFYSGQRVGGPIQKMDISALKQMQHKSKKSGCAGVLLSILLILGLFFLV